MKRGLQPKQAHNQKPAAKMTSEEALAEQITKEINERTEYLESMQGTISTVDENRITGEIRQRMRELKNLKL